MNTKNSEQASTPAEQEQKSIQASVEQQPQYKRVLAAEGAEGAEENTQPVDFRRVQHGHGPCSCCGPYSE